MSFILMISKVLLATFVLNRVFVRSEINEGDATNLRSPAVRGNISTNVKSNIYEKLNVDDLDSDYCSLLSTFCEDEKNAPENCSISSKHHMFSVCKNRFVYKREMQGHHDHNNEICELVVGICEEDPGYRKCVAKAHEMSYLCNYGKVRYMAQQKDSIFSSKFKLVSDVCAVSESILQAGSTIQQVKSYYPMPPMDLSRKVIAHSSVSLCNLKKFPISVRRGPIEAAFVFMSANTASYFLSSVLQNNVKNASVKWDPFSSMECTEKPNQSKTLNDYLTRECTMHTQCGKYECTDVKPDLSIIVANSRFLDDRIRWDQVFEKVNSRIILFRRTNLVLMSYSQFHHGGCQINQSTDVGYNIGNTFSFYDLLLCATHYALGDQEVQVSRALHAANKIKESPMLILYEDMISAGPIVQQKLLEHLEQDTSQSGNGIFPEEGRVPLCDNENINCKELRKNLQEQYPCLWKQLVYEGEDFAWTTPMLENGSINIHGDCYPLHSLGESKLERNIEEVYQYNPTKLHQW